MVENPPRLALRRESHGALLLNRPFGGATLVEMIIIYVGTPPFGQSSQAAPDSSNPKSNIRHQKNPYFCRPVTENNEQTHP